MYKRRQQAICKKEWKRTGNPEINNKNIQPGFKNGISHRKMYYV